MTENLSTLGYDTEISLKSMSRIRLKKKTEQMSQ